jgi:drug/metabolite transporter (DMT)-like permease
MRTPAKRIAFLALIVAGVCWGLGFPLGKLVLRETDAAHMVLLRFAVAAVVAAPFALRTPEARALFRSPVILAAGALYGIAFMVQFEGLAHVSVTLAALLVGAMPALIAISAKLLGEKVSRASWGGVAAATLGAALIAGKPDGAGSPLGVALSLGSLFIFLAWLIVLRRAPKTSERHGHTGGDGDHRRRDRAADLVGHARPAQAGPFAHGLGSASWAWACWAPCWPRPPGSSARPGWAAPAPGCSSISSR